MAASIHLSPLVPPPPTAQNQNIFEQASFFTPSAPAPAPPTSSPSTSSSHQIVIDPAIDPSITNEIHTQHIDPAIHGYSAPGEPTIQEYTHVTLPENTTLDNEYQNPNLDVTLDVNVNVNDEQKDKEHQPEQAQNPKKRTPPPQKSKPATKKRARIECTHPGCGRSFDRPAKLQEHLISHTGLRPFVCTHEGCTATFTREVNLQTHQRTHKPVEERPYGCEAQGCDKRFWTLQHVRRHYEQAHGGIKCPYCEQTFRKNFQLKTHAVSVHGINQNQQVSSSSATASNNTTKDGNNTAVDQDDTSTAILLPYQCTQEDCGKRFPSRAKLRAHSKRHDENRYACFHPKCVESGETPHFQTWSALQQHNKKEHPPSCPYPECEGRTFSKDNLRNHLRLHQEGKPLRKAQIKRSSWNCPVEECDQSFSSSAQARKHFVETHPDIHAEIGIPTMASRIPCPHFEDLGCTFQARRPALLETHLKNVHGTLDRDQSPQVDNHEGHFNPIDLVTNQLTGINYSQDNTYIQCPWHFMKDWQDQQLYRDEELLPQEEQLPCSTSDFDYQQQDVRQDYVECRHRFKRVYDLQRHLSSAHKFKIERDTLQQWLDDFHFQQRQQEQQEQRHQELQNDVVASSFNDMVIPQNF